MSDPFSVVHDALWDGLEAVDSGNIIRSGNRLDFNEGGIKKGNQSPKAVLQAADLPDLMLWLQNVDQTGGTSNGRDFTLNYLWLASTGTYDVQLIYPTIWLLARTVEWLDCHKGSYLLDGNQLILGAETPTGVISDVDSRLNRGAKGFSTLWTASVRVRVANTSIEA